MKIQKLTCFLLAVILLFGAFTMSVSAVSIEGMSAEEIAAEMGANSAAWWVAYSAKKAALEEGDEMH